jgi:hypothetical protein
LIPRLVATAAEAETLWKYAIDVGREISKPSGSRRMQRARKAANTGALAPLKDISSR